MKRPLRALAAILLLIVAAEIYGIAHTPTYEAELEAARAAYQTALAENMELTKKAALAGAAWWQR